MAIHKQAKRGSQPAQKKSAESGGSSSKAQGQESAAPATPPPPGTSAPGRKNASQKQTAAESIGRPAATSSSRARKSPGAGASPTPPEPAKPTRKTGRDSSSAKAAKPATPAAREKKKKPAAKTSAAKTSPRKGAAQETPSAAQPAAAAAPAPAAPAAPAVPQPAHPAVSAPLQASPTRAVLMIRDPEWLYTYWEISSADREAHAIGRPHGAPPLLLRVFELGSGANPADAGNAFDVTVLPEASGWYVHIPQGGGNWCVALGYLNYEGNFVPITISNVVTTPGPLQSDWNEQAWGPVDVEGEFLGGQGGVALGEAGGETALAGETPSRLVRHAARLISHARAGSSELAMRPGASEQLLRPGASEQLPLRPGASEQVLRPGASEQAVLRPGASEQLLRPGASEQVALPGGAQEKGKTFWLRVYTELIVYGATEPDARVTVQGQPIRLRPDGTFTLRFALPDGEQVIPVHASNADGDMARTITPVVTKKTV